MDPLPTPALPCPSCRHSGRGGDARIGNRRNQCKLCNSFNQSVRRQTLARLKVEHSEEYEKIRLEVEASLYPQVIEDYNRRHPGLEPEDIQLDEFGMVILP